MSNRSSHSWVVTTCGKNERAVSRLWLYRWVPALARRMACSSVRIPADTATLSPVSSCTSGHELLEPLHRLLVGPAHGEHDAELRRADGGRLAGGGEQLVPVEERRGLHDGVELGGLRAEVAVLGAAARLGGEDALHLDLGPAPRQPHLVGQRGQRRHALVGQRRQRRQLLGGELPPLVEEGVAGRGEEGTRRGHG